MRRVAWLLLACCAVLRSAEPLPRLPGPPGFFVPSARIQSGDDPAWARPDFDDRAWESLAFAATPGPPQLPSRAGPYWVRMHLRPIAPRMWRTDGISVSVVAAYDLYWDGQLISRNGVVGRDRESEVPGVLDNIVEIPEALRGPGPHVLALRMSSHRAGFPTPTFQLTVFFGDYRDFLTKRALRPTFPLLAAGGALVFGVVFALMWLLADRRPATLLFSALCLTAALMQSLQAWRWLYDYPFDWHYPRVLVIAWLVIALGALLLVYVQTFFHVVHRWWQLGLLAVLSVGAWQISPLYHVKSLAIVACALGISFATVVAAGRAGRRSAWLVALGLAISGYALWKRPRDFLEQSFFVSFGAPLVACATAHVLQWRDERRQARAALLTSARLEVELLKKNIQPHFLMNTLATILETIEQEPKTAAALVEALAGEFGILARVASEKLIPLGQELELCRAHLRVMRLRKGARCDLTVSGANEDDLVPPALFHTLIENGLTHLLPREGRQDFELRAEHRGEVTRYVLLARGERQAADRHRPAREGTGLRYIKARLEESFTGRWSLTAGPVLEGWETIIEIRQAGALARAALGAAAPAGLPTATPA